MSYPSNSAAAQGFALCHLCYNLDPVEFHLRQIDNLQRTLTLLITAVILFHHTRSGDHNHLRKRRRDSSG